MSIFAANKGVETVSKEQISFTTRETAFDILISTVESFNGAVSYCKAIAILDSTEFLLTIISENNSSLGSATLTDSSAILASVPFILDIANVGSFLSNARNISTSPRASCCSAVSWAVPEEVGGKEIKLHESCLVRTSKPLKSWDGPF